MKKVRCCENGYFGKKHNCRKSSPQEETKKLEKIFKRRMVMNCIYGGKTGEEMKQKIRDIIIIWLLLVTSFLVWRTDRHFENIQTIVDILKTKGW